MSGNASTEISGILGPVLMIMSASEYINFKIWRSVDPTVVYLNGLVLLIGGLIIIRCHNFWIPDWTLAITLSGWLLLMLGAYRMFYPSKPQVTKSKVANVILLILFLMGALLASRAYIF